MFLKNLLKNFKLNEGNISTLMGIAVMVLIGFLLIQYFQSTNKSPNVEKTLSTSTEQTITVSASEYVVKPNDSLWKIAQNKYGDGNNWVIIYEANKTTLGGNPSVIRAGTKITLPQQEVTKSILYTVKKGDSLWSVSETVCGSGYSWSQIASQNNLVQPGLIHPGNVLKISCPKK